MKILVLLMTAFAQESEVLGSNEYPTIISYMISFALYTENLMSSAYTFVRSSPPYNLIVFYMILLIVLYKLLRGAVSRSNVVFTYKVVNESGQAELIKMIDQKHEELKGLLTQPQSGVDLKSLQSIIDSVEEIKNYQHEFQDEIFQSHKDIWEQLHQISREDEEDDQDYDIPEYNPRLDENPPKQIEPVTLSVNREEVPPPKKPEIPIHEKKPSEGQRAVKEDVLLNPEERKNDIEETKLPVEDNSKEAKVEEKEVRPFRPPPPAKARVPPMPRPPPGKAPDERSKYVPPSTIKNSPFP